MCFLYTWCLLIPIWNLYETLNSIHQYEDIYENSELLSKVTPVYGITWYSTVASIGLDSKLIIAPVYCTIVYLDPTKHKDTA